MTGARDGSPAAFDIAVIGAGVVGTAIAREASRYQWTVALIDAADDVGTGTSKANTAILHTGFDAEPGSLEAQLVRRGWELFALLAPDLGIPVERTGAVLVAWTPDEVAELSVIDERAAANGYLGTRRLDPDELYAREPNLGPGAAAALEVPDESIICTFTTPLAFATQAVINGTHLRLGSAVVGIERGASEDHLVSLADGSVLSTRWLVNAAGLESDRVDRMLGHARFVIRPRRGELIVFDKLARGLVERIVLPVPTSAGKGVLVAPTVFGNVILGPTAEDVSGRQDTSTTAVGITSLLERGRRIMPALVEQEVTATYAGLRAATEHKDYQIHLDADQRYVCVGGIRSTGLTASPAIAEHVLGLIRTCGVALRPKPDFRSVLMPPLGEVQVRRYRDADAISSEPRYGSIVCHCERVTRGEIADALESPIPARSVDGLRRRTRALLGRCQGFHCLAEVVGLVAEHTGREVDALLEVPGSVSAHV